MSSIELKSRAKINLSIDVLGKREDGYHLVEMIMQTIDLYDIIKIKEIEIDEININSNSSDIPLNENNIVYKAAKVLKDQFNIKNGVEIFIEKTYRKHLTKISKCAILYKVVISQIKQIGKKDEKFL